VQAVAGARRRRERSVQQRQHPPHVRLRWRSRGCKYHHTRQAVLRIRIHTFLDLLDPDPSVRGMDPDPDLDPSITKQKSKKNLDSYCFVTSFDFLSLKMMYMYLQEVKNKQTFLKN
jgi:hypothetical protein